MRKILLTIQYVKWSILQTLHQWAYELSGDKNQLMKSLAYHDLLFTVETLGEG